MSADEFGVEDVEILTELMNIGFGAAAADLSSIIDLMVQISVPKVQILGLDEYRAFLTQFQETHKYLTISEQSFEGKVSGSGILILPGENPFFILSNVDSDIEESQEAGQDVLSDLTHLMVGASISKISELLEEMVSFNSPETVCWVESSFPESMIRNDEMHIVLEANFSLESGDHKGYLLLVTREESTAWLKEALVKFMDQYS